MVPKTKRLPPGFKFSNAQSFHTAFFRIKRQKNYRNTFRVGFVISKKIDKRAVKRNRIRRILSSEIDSLYVKQLVGYDILCILTKPVSTDQEALVRNEFKTVIQKGL